MGFHSFIAGSHAVPSIRMSTARRAYDVLRGYVSHGWDQLTGDEEKSANDELLQAIESPVPNLKSQSSIQAPTEAAITLDQARKLFDVPPNATSQQITEVYDALRSTADLSKFTEGTDAWQRARQVSRRLDAARNILMENIDPTVRRFERLEIE
jgi:hypothetical protein